MNIFTDIPLCPRAHDAIRRCLEAAQPDAGSDLPPTPGEPANAPPLFCCIQASLRGRPAWPFPAAPWDTRKYLASVLTDKAVRRAYAAQAIREAQVPAILGKDLGWGLVYYRVHNRQHARLYVIPADPHTPARDRMRAIMRAVSQAYDTLLTPEQRRAWLAAGEKVLSRRRLTRGPLTGQQLFVKLNSVLTLVGRDLLLWPPEPHRFGLNPVEAVVPSYDNGQFRLALKLSGPVAGDIMVFGEAPVGPKRNKLRHPVYLGLLPASADGLADIAAQYVARFGEPAPGRKVLLGVQQQVNGWKGPMQVLGEVVPPRPVEAPRNTQTTRTGAGAPASCRLRPFYGSTVFRGMPRFQRVAPPGYRRGTSVVPACNPGAAPLCMATAGRTPPIVARGYLRAGLKPVWRVGRAGAGCGLAANRRKCHQRHLWRGT